MQKFVKILAILMLATLIGSTQPTLNVPDSLYPRLEILDSDTVVTSTLEQISLNNQVYDALDQEIEVNQNLSQIISEQNKFGEGFLQERTTLEKQKVLAKLESSKYQEVYLRDEDLIDRLNKSADRNAKLTKLGIFLAFLLGVITTR